MGSGRRDSVSSHEYEQFKLDTVPKHHTFYERAAIFSGKVFGIDPGKKSEKIGQDLEDAHLACSPKDATSLSVLAPVAVLLLSVVGTVLVPLAFGSAPSLYFLFFSFVLAGLVYIPLSNMPAYLATRWRQRASNQMVLSVFYIVTYMRHTPNFELALEFAADHIGPPLSLDLIKVLWDVETQRFQTVTDSLEHYLRRWHGSAREFVEAIHLIEASLYESSNDRRLASLDKSLDVMLEETYEKMLHYAQDLKSPLTMLHMLGIILPILGLVILPLAVSFFPVHWTVIFSMYNVILPFFVWYIGKRVLSTRPTGYGQADISQVGAALERGRKALSPGLEAGLIGGFFFLIGVSPVIIHLVAPEFDVVIGAFSLIGYKVIDGVSVGPFGLGAGLLSVFVTLAFGIGLSHYYRRRTKKLIKIRERSRQLESEFASALFQLGNRIGEGMPAEIAFGKVAKMMEGTLGGAFYRSVALNIQKLGMGVEEAIFHPEHGALRQYPSDLIESSMKVLLESSRKGPQEASKALMSMSNYIREMHRVDERLKDLLADVLSSMKSQINFLLPTIAGIVIGITSMITTVLGAVKSEAEAFKTSGAIGGQDLPLDIFGLGIPAFYFQIVVGLYVVQVTWILATLISGIENGVDVLSEDWLKARALLLSTLLYCGLALVVMLVFNLLAGQIISSTSPAF